MTARGGADDPYGMRRAGVCGLMSSDVVHADASANDAGGLPKVSIRSSRLVLAAEGALRPRRLPAPGVHVRAANVTETFWDGGRLRPFGSRSTTARSPR
jgi:hypothetical protein